MSEREVMALEVRLRSLFVGELEARVTVAIAPLRDEIRRLRSEVDRLAWLHPVDGRPPTGPSVRS